MIVGSCAENRRSQLDDLESAIEQNPDSVLSVLSAYQLPSTAPESQKALYNYLLTYARYKCFIDETDDSRIRQAAEYYLNHDKSERKALSQYLLGIIQKNRGELGSAAITLTQAAEFCKRQSLYLYEGFCRRGLSSIYNTFFNHQKELLHAKEEYQAFKKTGQDEWMNIGALDILCALCNSAQHEKSLSMAKRLYYNCLSQNDKHIAAHAISIAGRSSSSLGRYTESVKYFIAALMLIGELPELHDWQIFMVSLSHIPNDSINSSDLNLISSLNPLTTKQQPFDVLYQQGRYKEAYEALEIYRSEQDKMLSLISSEDVSTSLYKYAETLETQRIEKERVEKLSISAVIVFLIVMIIFGITWFRHRLKKKQRDNDDLISRANGLISELNLQQRQNIMLTDSVKELLSQKFETVDSLCLQYYETHGTALERKRIIAEVESQIMKIGRDPQTINDLEDFVNHYADNLISKFRLEIPNLKDDEVRFFMYTVIGFSARSISLFLDDKVENIYNRKSRLKSKIKNSDSASKVLFLSYF